MKHINDETEMVYKLQIHSSNLQNIIETLEILITCIEGNEKTNAELHSLVRVILEYAKLVRGNFMDIESELGIL